MLCLLVLCFPSTFLLFAFFFLFAAFSIKFFLLLLCRLGISYQSSKKNQNTTDESRCSSNNKVFCFFFFSCNLSVSTRMIAKHCSKFSLISSDCFGYFDSTLNDLKRRHGSNPKALSKFVTKCFVFNVD